MDLYCFVYDFVIFSLIDDYDDVFGELEWFDLRIYVKKEENEKTVRARNGGKQGDFGIKLVMIRSKKIIIFGG